MQENSGVVPFILRHGLPRVYTLYAINSIFVQWLAWMLLYKAWEVVSKLSQTNEEVVDGYRKWFRHREAGSHSSGCRFDRWSHIHSASQRTATGKMTVIRHKLFWSFKRSRDKLKYLGYSCICVIFFYIFLLSTVYNFCGRARSDQQMITRSLHSDILKTLTWKSRTEISQCMNTETADTDPILFQGITLIATTVLLHK